MIGAGKVRVHPVKLQNALPGICRDGIKRVAWLHLHGLLRPENEKALPGREPVRLPQTVIPGKKARRESDSPADRVQRIAGLHDDDLHTITSTRSVYAKKGACVPTLYVL